MQVLAKSIWKVKFWGLLGVALVAIPNAYAGEWHVGPQISYASGIPDVTDLYEKNYNATHTTTYVKIRMLLPIGVAFAADYQWKSGLRADLGVGPFFMMRSDNSNNSSRENVDLTHYEMPVSATVGYSFIANGDVSPYLRAGFAYHFVSGEYYRSASPGPFAAAGIEFSRKHSARYIIEVASDQSKVEFDNFACNGTGCPSTVKLNTYDVVASFAAKFKL